MADYKKSTGKDTVQVIEEMSVGSRCYETELASSIGEQIRKAWVVTGTGTTQNMTTTATNHSMNTSSPPPPPIPSY